MANPNFDEWLSTTLANHMPTMVDNVFNRRPLAWKLKDKVKKKTGGHKIVIPVNFNRANGGGSYYRYDRLSMETSEVGTVAEFAWKQYQQPVIIDGLSEFVNSGDPQVIDLLAEKVKQAEMTMTEDLNTMWYADGTGNSDKDMNGLLALIGDGSDSVTTVGGIDCTVDTGWVSPVYRNAGTFSATSGDTKNGFVKMRTAWNAASGGTNDTVDLLITTQGIYEAFENNIDSRIRYEDTAMANAGFENITFKKKPLTWDEDIPSGPGGDHYLFGVNTDHVYLVGGGKWFKSTPFVTPPDGDYKSSHVLVYGNMVTDSRRHSFRIEFDGV